MSGEDLASTYSFGEYDDFSEFDILPENDNESVSVDVETCSIPKSNILVLSDIQESFVVLGRDILQSIIKEQSNGENPESSRQMDYEVNNETASYPTEEAGIENKVFKRYEELENTLKKRKKSYDNLKDLTERFRSSSPLFYDSNCASPSNEDFFISTRKNRTKNVEKERKLGKKMWKSNFKTYCDDFVAFEKRIMPILDNINSDNIALKKVLDLIEHQDSNLAAEMKLKNTTNSVDEHTKKSCECAMLRDRSENMIHKKNLNKKSKQLINDFKRSIEVFENSASTSTSNDSLDSSSSSFWSNSNNNKYNNVSGRKFSYENGNSKIISCAVVINYTICIVFMFFMFFLGVILLDLLKKYDEIIHSTTHAHPVFGLFKH